MKSDNLYVAATNQHVGKTTSTLGLVSVLRQEGVNIGYCKPVGQRYLTVDNLRVDKDTLLFADLLGFKILPDMHSPVILGDGATTAYLDNPQAFGFEARIDSAARYLEDKHDLVIYEGTGHPGVGSVVNLSNARVAKRLNAAVIMIVEGGIGSTIDRLNVSIAIFRENNVPIKGVIINKVIPEKLEKIRHYVGIKLREMNLPLLGVVPYDEAMAYPILKTICSTINGSVVLNNDFIERQVEDVVSGTLLHPDRLREVKNALMVVGVDRIERALSKVKRISEKSGRVGSPLAGVVGTGEGDIGEEAIEYLRMHNIPLIRTHLDTFGSVMKISRIEVKINLNTPWKVSRAIELIRENVDLDQLMQRFVR